MSLNKRLIARLILALVCLLMAALTIPAYLNPSLNPALATLTGEALSLGSAAGAFLGRQATILVLAAIGIGIARRDLLLAAAFVLGAINAHDAIFLFLFGSAESLGGALGGLVFAALAGLSFGLIWTSEDT